MCVQTEELFESRDAESVIRSDLVRAVSEAVDTAFIDPANAGIPDEAPASVTFGLTPSPLVATPASDIATAMDGFAGDFMGTYIVAHPEYLLGLDENDFPNVDVRTGGTIKGLPVIPSASLPKDANGAHQLVIIDPTGIAYTSRDEAAQIKATEQGTIEMLDTGLEQDALAGTGTSNLVSMFQSNSVAIAALLHENWRVERPRSVLLLNSEAV